LPRAGGRPGSTYWGGVASCIGAWLPAAAGLAAAWLLAGAWLVAPEQRS
jgi:hypothetical protein